MTATSPAIEMAALNAVAQADLVRRGEVAPAELAQWAIERIEELNRDTPEYAAAMVRALPQGSQLGVVPGASHELPFEKPGLVHQLILEFLTDQQVDKMIHPADEP